MNLRYEQEEKIYQDIVTIEKHYQVSVIPKCFVLNNEDQYQGSTSSFKSKVRKNNFYLVKYSFGYNGLLY